MFHHLPKFLGFLALAAITCGTVPATAQSLPEAKTDEPGEARDTKATPLPPSPYEIGADYRYTWIMEGKEFATTVLTLDTVTDANGTESLRLRGRLDYDRAGRILTGSSALSFEGTDLRRPTKFTGTLEIGVPNMGSHLDEVVVRFEGGKAISSKRSGEDRLERTETEVRVPTWVLEANCFEHWAIVAPHLASIVEDGELTFFIPTGNQEIRYKITRERREKVGEGFRDRWSIRHPSQIAWIWTDAEGRLVEYRQDPVQIILAEVTPPKKEKADAAPAEKKSGAEPDKKETGEKETGQKKEPSSRPRSTSKPDQN